MNTSSKAFFPVVIALHAIVWTCLPLLFEGSIRLDVAEHVIQGREWLLAYPKQPPFSMWLVAVVSELGPLRYVSLYLLGQILALSGLLFAASLLLRHKGAPAAGLAVLIGLASPFLTYVPIEVNHNIGVMPFWGLALAAGFFAFERGRLGDWLLFGAAVGLGMWAKYSILQLALPLVVAFFAVPEWRRQLATPGPWLAGVLAAAIAAPQLVAVIREGSGAFDYALRTNAAGPANVPKFFFEFMLNAVVLIAMLGIVPAVAAGFPQLRQAIAQSFARARTDRFTLYVHVALFGPLMVIAIASLFGVRPRILWLTPVALSAALWWAEKVQVQSRRAFAAAAVVAVILAASYSIWHMAKPRLVTSPSYSDFDGPALARMAEKFWRDHASGPIPYIVTFDRQRGRQAAGSIAFDSADRPRVFEEASGKLSPWIDAADVARRGALIVSPRPLTPADNVAGRPVEFISEFARPTVGAFAKPRSIYLGVVPPAR